MTLPLGIRSNNPGNLRPGAAPWKGQIGTDPRGYCIFDRPENGVRAIAGNLLSYQDKHALHTIRGLVTRWAPPGENNTTAYINSVVLDSGHAADEHLNLRDPSLLDALVAAIILHENGYNPYPPRLLVEAVNDALSDFKLAA